eukprot:359599_1
MEWILNYSCMSKKNKTVFQLWLIFALYVLVVFFADEAIDLCYYAYHLVVGFKGDNVMWNPMRYKEIQPCVLSHIERSLCLELLNEVYQFSDPAFMPNRWFPHQSKSLFSAFPLIFQIGIILLVITP